MEPKTHLDLHNVHKEESLFMDCKGS